MLKKVSEHRGMPLSLPKSVRAQGDASFFYHVVFLCLFGDTFCIVVSAFFALSCDSISLELDRHFFIFAVFRSPALHIQIFWGSPKTPALAFSGARFGASGSSPENTLKNP